MSRTYGEVDESDDLHVDLGLRPESRTERRANRRKQRARRGFGCFAGIVSLVVVAGLIGGIMFGFGKGRDYLEGMFAAPDYEGEGTGSVQVRPSSSEDESITAPSLARVGPGPRRKASSKRPSSFHWRTSSRCSSRWGARRSRTSSG